VPVPAGLQGHHRLLHLIPFEEPLIINIEPQQKPVPIGKAACPLTIVLNSEGQCVIPFRLLSDTRRCITSKRPETRLEALQYVSVLALFIEKLQLHRAYRIKGFSEPRSTTFLL
jgi:hypothetical protein